MLRGDIHQFRPARGMGHGQQGRRYGVIVQANELLPRSVVLIAPASHSARAASFRPEIDLLGETTRVLVEQIGAVDASRLGDLAGRVSPEQQWGIDEALLDRSRPPLGHAYRGIAELSYEVLIKAAPAAPLARRQRRALPLGRPARRAALAGSADRQGSLVTRAGAAHSRLPRRNSQAAAGVWARRSSLSSRLKLRRGAPRAWLGQSISRAGDHGLLSKPMP